jgi:hypothetical protein
MESEEKSNQVCDCHPEYAGIKGVSYNPITKKGEYWYGDITETGDLIWEAELRAAQFQH